MKLHPPRADLGDRVDPAMATSRVLILLYRHSTAWLHPPRWELPLVHLQLAHLTHLRTGHSLRGASQLELPHAAADSASQKSHFSAEDIPALGLAQSFQPPPLLPLASRDVACFLHGLRRVPELKLPGQL